MKRSILLLLKLLCLITCLQGQDQFSTSKVDSIVSRFMVNDKVPGIAVAILHKGKILFIKTYGISNLEQNTAVNRKTVFELASVTKQMTAGLIVTLGEQGKLQLDDKISKYLERTPDKWKDITVRQLLGHMAGLRHSFEPKLNDSYLLNYSKAFLLEAAMKTPMNSIPGTDWEYSDQGYFLAGYIAEKATGMRYDSLMKENIFRPLGMTDTRFLDQDDIIPFRAAGYIIKDGEYKNNRRQWDIELTPHFGVMSTIDDMVKYEKGIVEGKILQEVINKITTPYRRFDKEDDFDSSYGMGWEIRDFGKRRIVTHSGYTGTVYLRDLKTGLSIILLTNRDENQGTSQHVLVRKIAKAVDESFPEF